MINELLITGKKMKSKKNEWNKDSAQVQNPFDRTQMAVIFFTKTNI